MARPTSFRKKISWVGEGGIFWGGRVTYRDYLVKLEGEKKRVFR